MNHFSCKQLLNKICFSTVTALSLVLGVTQAGATDLMQDFDSLGGNDVIVDRARALNPDEKISIVQDRVVSRRWREEVTTEYSNVLGGDAYVVTHNFGLNYNVHISPHWSVGAKYNYALNDLSHEGRNLIRTTGSDGKAIIPDIDYAKQTAMALVDWYPIYGKMNLYDLGIVHFDIYALAGYGAVQLNSGTTGTWTAGGGIGLWFSQHLTTRFEMRYQRYEAKPLSGKQPMDLTVAGLQIGYLHNLF
jgi:outer membrane immunogenic protein